MADTVAAVPSSSAAAAAPVVPGTNGSEQAGEPGAFKHPSGIIPQLQNVVSTVNLSCQLDLASIAQRARNAEYNPKRFAACIVRIKDPKTTALMFNSGKMVIAGAKSEEQSRLAARKYTKILMKLGYQVQFTDFMVQNMVASCSVQFPIRLEGLAARFDIFCNYEPEVFPGLVFRMQNPKLVLLIFVTGKIVLTGAKRVEQIYEAFENVYAVLQDFRKGDARRIVRQPTAALPAGTTPALPMPGAGDGQLAQGLKRVMGGDVMGVSDDIMAEDGNGASTSHAGNVVPPPTVPTMLPPPHTGGGIPPPATIPAPTPGTFNIPPPTPATHFIPPSTPGPSTLPPPATPGILPPPPSYH